MMNVSSSALSDMKDRLKPTVTKVISEDGRVRLESDGVTEDTEDTHPGFVIDNKPDLTISQVSQEIHTAPRDAVATHTTLTSYGDLCRYCLGSFSPVRMLPGIRNY